MTDLDPVKNAKISAIADALEEAAATLMSKEPFDNSNVVAAVGKFNGRQEQANALCSAVEQVSLLHHATNPSLPKLSITGQTVKGSDWASLHVFAEIPVTDKQATIQEPIFTLPFKTRDQVSQTVCNLYTLPKQANMHPANVDAAVDPIKPPEPK